MCYLRVRFRVLAPKGLEQSPLGTKNSEERLTRANKQYFKGPAATFYFAYFKWEQNELSNLRKTEQLQNTGTNEQHISTYRLTAGFNTHRVQAYFQEKKHVTLPCCGIWDFRRKNRSKLVGYITIVTWHFFFFEDLVMFFFILGVAHLITDIIPLSSECCSQPSYLPSMFLVQCI